MIRAFFSNLEYKRHILWIYAKYQIVSKGALSILILPIFSVVINQLILSTGRTTISSGDYLPFLLSYHGIGMLIASFVLMSILIAFDINAFIFISAMLQEKKYDIKKYTINTKELIIIAIKSIKSFLSPTGALIMLYVSIIMPLVGIGISITPMRGFQIPNFITFVIYNNPLYLSLYLAVLLSFAMIGFIFIFSFHYVIILKNDIKSALKNSAGLMKRHWKAFIKDFILWSLMISIIISLLISIFFLFLFITYSLKVETIFSRVITFFVLINTAEIIAAALLMTTPIIVNKLTELFYKYNALDEIVIEFNPEFQIVNYSKSNGIIKKYGFKLFIIITLLIILSINLISSMIMSFFFDEIFRNHRQIAIIAHRGGGDLGAENSIEGLENAIAENAQWSEIDVQRTKDGHYIINHDSTFSRLSGVKKASTDMTLEEIKKLRIKNEFNPDAPDQPVASLEEMLDTSKGRIGLFVELKGKSADYKMADDVIQMIIKKDMQTQTVLLSLDYDLINYIENKYPQIDTGYLYFFAIGKAQNLVGDYLIMEEREATDKKIQSIKSMGKKAIVWTVNTDESINKFIHSNVDGIITDYVKKVNASIQNRHSRSDLEIIINELFGF